MKINVIGLGYIGLPTAVMFARAGAKVTGVDVDPTRLQKIKSLEAGLEEPEIRQLLNHVLSDGSLVVDAYPSALATIHFICVPTPVLENRPDISFVQAAIKTLERFLKPGDSVVIESTCPVGTTELMQSTVEKSIKTINWMYCPERVIPGSVIHELVENSRTIGVSEGSDPSSVREAYKLFVKGRLNFTDARTAEMVKLVENASRDVAIAFANEISMLCGQLGVHYEDVIAQANQHPRVSILTPGIGVGGHCIPVDPWFLISEYPMNTELMRTAREVNTKKTEWVIQKVIDQIKTLNLGAEEPIGLLGLSYKPDVGDFRESPALQIHKSLMAIHSNILVYEPYGHETLQSIKFVSLERIIDECSLVLILVPHTEIRERVTEIHASGLPYLNFTGTKIEQ